MAITSSGLSLEALENKYNVGVDAAEIARQTGEDIAAVFELLPAVESIELVGHTPYFNDGDACTHSQDTSVNGYGTSYNDEPCVSDQRVWVGSEGELKGGYREDMEEEEQENEGDAGPKAPATFLAEWLGATPTADIDRAALLMEDEPAVPASNGRTEAEFHEQTLRAIKILDAMELQIYSGWDTNFHILITRTDNGIDIKHSDYEPGY